MGRPTRAVRRFPQSPAGTGRVRFVTVRWEPARRLALVSALADMAGVESEALMDAHGLGAAYRSPSGSSSKKARINAALHEAQNRGDIDDVLDAVAKFLGVPTGGESVAQPEGGPKLPAPDSDDQAKVLQAVWDLFYAHRRWPTFAAVDTFVDQQLDLDAVYVAQSLPAGLLQPPDLRNIQPDYEVKLTAAGAAACAGSREELAAFLTAVRLATDIERHPRDASKGPVLTSAALHRTGNLPAAGREDIVRRTGALLSVEPWGWTSFSSPSGDQWTFTIGREARRLRGVRSLADYWQRVHAQAPAIQTQTPREPIEMTTRETIFLVHGHDDARHEVRRFLERVVRDVDVVVLDEQVSRGRTIIEKFESFGAAASAAVVLLTPDDVGRAVHGEGVDKPRARQNVVFELGYFVGKLGRDRVVVLKKGDIEEPSDVGAVVYIPYPGGDWRFRVVKELQEHFEVDLSAAISG